MATNKTKHKYSIRMEQEKKMYSRFQKKKYYGKMCKNVAKDQLTNDIFKLKQKHTIRTTAKSKTNKRTKTNYYYICTAEMKEEKQKKNARTLKTMKILFAIRAAMIRMLLKIFLPFFRIRVAFIFTVNNIYSLLFVFLWFNYQLQFLIGIR